METLLQKLSRAWDAIVAFAFGDDIFVSYSREDGVTYAVALATELTNRGFTTRLDQWGTEPNEELPSWLKRALRRSAALALVATPCAAVSQPVAEEVSIVKRAKRLIIPIVFPGIRLRDGSAVVNGKIVRCLHADLSPPLRDPLWGNEIAGLPMSIEGAGAISPSAQVLDRIEKTCTFRRRNNRLRLTASVLVAALAVLLGAAGFTARLATANAKEASAQAKEAARQTEIARAQAAAGASQSLRLRSLQQADWNDTLQESALLAVEAASRLGSLGFSPLESQRSLRDVLDLLPRSVRHLTLNRTAYNVYLAPDGSRVVTKDARGTLEIWDPETGRRLAELPGSAAWQIDPQVAVLAAADPDGVALRSLADPTSVRRLRGGVVQTIKFSPDGSRIAAVIGNQRSTLEVWQVAAGKKMAEIHLAGPAVDMAISQDNETLGVTMSGPVSGQTLLETWSIDQAPVRLTHQRLLVNQEESGTSHETLRGLVFSPDGSRIAGESGYHVLVLGTRSATGIRRLKALEQDANSRNDRIINRFFFAPDGNTIGLTISDGSYAVWDARAEVSVDGSPTGFFDFEMMSDTPMFGIPSPKGLKIVDIRTGSPIIRALHGPKARPCGWSDQGRFVAVCADRELWVYEAGSAQQAFLESGPAAELNFGRGRASPSINVSSPDAHGPPVVLRYKGELASSVALSSDRDFAAAVIAPPSASTSAYNENSARSRTGDLFIWQLSSGRSLRIPGVLAIVQPEGYDEAISATDSLYFSPLGRFVALASKNQQDEDVATVWATADGRLIVRDAHTWGSFNSLRFTDDDRYLIIYEVGRSRVIDTANGKTVVNIGEVPFDVSTRRALLAQRTGRGISVNKTDGALLYEIEVAGHIGEFKFSHSGTYLAVAGPRKVELFLAASGERVFSSDCEELVGSIEFDSDERYLMAFGKEKHLATWTLLEGRSLGLATSARGPWDTKFSSNGALMLVTKSDNVEIWSVRGMLEKSINAGGRVRALEISPDARYVAIYTDAENLVRVWQREEGWNELAALPTEGNVSELEFSADSEYLVVGKRTAWMLSSRRLTEKACGALTRNLSPTEWRRAFGDTAYRATCRHLGG